MVVLGSTVGVMRNRARVAWIGLAWAAASLALGASPGVDAQYVLATYPSQNAINVPRDTYVAVHFGTSIENSSVNDTTFLVYGSYCGYYRGRVRYDSLARVASFLPKTRFQAGELVTATLTKYIRTVGVEFFPGFTWQFTVAATNPTDARFVERARLSWNNGTHGISLADINADGAVDILAIAARFSSLRTWFNDGTGMFTIPGFDYGVAYYPDHLRAADFDRDGDVDVVLGIRTRSYHPDLLWTLINNGSGFFPDTTMMITRSNYLYPLAIADLDCDGYIDVVGGDWSYEATPNMYMYQNTRAMRFALAASLSLRPQPKSLFIGDFDRDGRLDLIVSCFDNYDISRTELWRNEGNWCFDQSSVVDSLPYVEAVADFNGDGYLDLALHDWGRRDLRIMINDGHGGFYETQLLETGFDVDNSCTTDLDGDGDLDLVEVGEYLVSAMPEEWLGFMRILLNRGDGHFEFVREDTIGTRARYIGSADVDDDGDIDLVVAEYYGPVHILANERLTCVASGRAVSQASPVSLRICPNPFNSATRITYSVPTRGRVIVRIYNLKGEVIRTLANGFQGSGEHTVVWDGKNHSGEQAPSGLYLCRLATEAGTLCGKVTLVR